MIVDNLYLCKDSLHLLSFQDIIQVLKKSTHDFNTAKDLIINERIVINTKIDHKGEVMAEDLIEICYFLIF